MLRTSSTDISDRRIPRILVLRFVEIEAEEGDGINDSFAEHVALLADAAGEDDGVDLAAAFDVVAADVAEDAVGEDVKGQFGVVAGVGFGDLGEIRGAGQRFPAGLLVEDVFGLGDVQLFGGAARHAGGRAGVVEDQAGVDVAGAGAAGQARDGG